MIPKTTLCTVLLCCAVFFSHAQGKLNKAKNDLSSKSSSSSTSSSSSSSSSWNEDDDDDENFFASLFVEIIYEVTYGVFIGSIEPRTFYGYPFENGNHGEYDTAELDGKRLQFIASNTFFVSGSEFYGNDVKLNFRFMPELGVAVNHLHFFERNPNVELGLSSLMLNYYRIREEQVTGYWGIGATYIGNGVDETGFSYNVGLDIYIKKPYSVGLFWKQTFVNSSAVNELQGTIKYHLKRAVVSGGYNYYKLGSVNISSAAFGLEYRF